MLNYDLDVNFSRGGAVLLSGYCPALIFRKSSLRTFGIGQRGLGWDVKGKRFRRNRYNTFV